MKYGIVCTEVIQKVLHEAQTALIKSTVPFL